jgi:hypothetical protein
MDNGKDAWDSFTTDHGSFPLVHVAKHSMVGINHGWYPHVYFMTMVLNLGYTHVMCLRKLRRGHWKYK